MTQPPAGNYWRLHDIEKKIDLLNKKADKIMALVSIDQTVLDDVASKLEALVAVIGTIPTGTLPPANAAALETAVTDVTTAVDALAPPPAPTPVP